MCRSNRDWQDREDCGLLLLNLGIAERKQDKLVYTSCGLGDSTTSFKIV